MAPMETSADSSVACSLFNEFPYRPCFNHSPNNPSVPETVHTLPSVSGGEPDASYELPSRSSVRGRDNKDKNIEVSQTLSSSEIDTTSPLKIDPGSEQHQSNSTFPVLPWKTNLLQDDEIFDPKSDKESHSDSTSEYNEEKEKPPC